MLMKDILLRIEAWLFSSGLRLPHIKLGWLCMWKDSKPRLGDLNIYVGSPEQFKGAMTVVCPSPEDHSHSKATASSLTLRFSRTGVLSSKLLLKWVLQKSNRSCCPGIYGAGLTSSSPTLEVTPIGANLLSFFRRSP